jgi:hypothetical protein
MRNRFSNRETLNFQVSGPSGANQPNIVTTSNMVKSVIPGPISDPVRNAELPGTAGIRSIGSVIVGIGMSPSVETIRAAADFATGKIG